MSWRDRLPVVRGKLLRDEPLGPFTWFRVGGPADLPAIVREEVKPGDLVVLLGAGDITSWAYALPDQLTALAAE